MVGDQGEEGLSKLEGSAWEETLVWRIEGAGARPTWQAGGSHLSLGEAETMVRCPRHRLHVEARRMTWQVAEKGYSQKQEAAERARCHL